MSESIKAVLMRRDNMTAEEADDAIEEAKLTLQEYIDNGDMDSAMDVCNECFGLEPDYLDELMPF